MFLVINLSAAAALFILGESFNYSQLSLIRIRIIRTFTNSNQIPRSPQNFLTNVLWKNLNKSNLYNSNLLIQTVFAGPLSEELFIIRTFCGLKST